MRPQFPGRPSRDGKSFLSANLGPRGSSKVYVHAVDRASRQHRFSREYTLPLPVLSILMLDSDASGVIYLAVSGEEPHPPEEVRPAHWVRLLCLDPLDGCPPMPCRRRPSGTSPCPTAAASCSATPTAEPLLPVAPLRLAAAQ